MYGKRDVINKNDIESYIQLEACNFFSYKTK